MANEDVLVMILAGGEGKRLHPLTKDRAKPAVPFGGRYRIIDFVLNNFGLDFHSLTTNSHGVSPFKDFNRFAKLHASIKSCRCSRREVCDS